jgi:S1-C subfamily serine protease
MKYLLRPYRVTFRSPHAGIAAALALATGFALAPHMAAAQTAGISQVLDQTSPMLHGSQQQGYLGVLVGDVDSDTASKLKLKENRGAVVTLIDHDAPAAQAGVRVNDVVLEVNGQGIDNAEAFTRMMRDLPAGRKITLALSHDGAPESITVELVDHKKMEHDVWNRLDNGGDPVSNAPTLGILPGASGDIPSGVFHMPFFGATTLNVGAMVEPLTSQMAEYLGVQGGLMIKQVARKSEAETAGLKAYDIILKVGAEGIATTADWDRALRVNQNKPVPVTILRDRRQQTVNLQVDSKRRHSSIKDAKTPVSAPMV